MSHLKGRFCLRCRQSPVVVPLIPAEGARSICLDCARTQEWHMWTCRCGVWRWMDEHCEMCQCSVEDVAERY